MVIDTEVAQTRRAQAGFLVFGAGLLTYIYAGILGASQAKFDRYDAERMAERGPIPNVDFAYDSPVMAGAGECGLFDVWEYSFEIPGLANLDKHVTVCVNVDGSTSMIYDRGEDSP